MIERMGVVDHGNEHGRASHGVAVVDLRIALAPPALARPSLAAERVGEGALGGAERTLRVAAEMKEQLARM